MDVSHLLDSLNDRQREAVSAEPGPLLVLAGAGSGKTRVLTERIAHLIRDKNVSPREILAFTFTNRAAREMKERIEAGFSEEELRELATLSGSGPSKKTLRAAAKILRDRFRASRDTAAQGETS